MPYRATYPVGISAAGIEFERAVLIINGSSKVSVDPNLPEIEPESVASRHVP
jgi:hypothetical protein